MSRLFLCPVPSTLPLLVSGLFAVPVQAQVAVDVQTGADVQASAEAQQQSAASVDASATTLSSVRVRAAREAAISVGSASTRLPLLARETPQSVSSISRETVEARGLTSLDDVMRHTPGVMTALYDPQRPLYYVRGFKIEDFQLDGLPSYHTNVNQEYDSAFYERVDVVRGANGILTGVGVPSATINMIRKRPETEFGGSITGTLGSWQFYRLVADVNVPFTSDGRVRSRFVVAPQKQKSFYDRYSKDQLALMGMVEADVGEDTTVSIGYQRQNNQPKAPVWGTIPLLATDGGWINLPVSTSFSPDWTFWNRNTGMAFVELSHKLTSDWQLKASYARLSGSHDFLNTYAYGPTQSGPAFVDRVTGAGVSVFPWRRRGRATQDALDVYATGKLALGGRKHDLTVGFNSQYLKDKSDKFELASGGPYVIPNVFAWRGEMPRVNYAATGAYDDNITQQAGLFASARWRLMDELALLTGARLTNWSTRKKSYDQNGAYTDTSARLEIRREFTPYLGLVYDLNPDVALYGSHARIFNPQDRRDRHNQVLEPTVGSSTELGVKTRLTNGLNLNAGLFQTKQDNFAVLDSGVPPQSLPDGSSAHVGVDGTKAHGLELVLDGRVRPALDVMAGVAYVKTKRHDDDLIYANFPEWLVQLAADYRFSGEWSPLSAGVGLNWQSKIEAFNVPTPDGGKTTLSDKARMLVNLHATWRLSEDYSLTATVTNLTNKRYWANLDYANRGEPRRFTLGVQAKF